MHTEETVEHAVVDEWTRQQFLAERESEILNLPYRHRQSRREMSHKAEEVFIRYLPDTEESQHMIDTDGIEILLHPAQAMTEPSRQLRAPPVGREAPVLSVQRESIGRCSRLGIQMEQFRTGGRLHTLAIHPDGHVALQHDAFRTGIVGSRLQLTMKMILDVIDEGRVKSEK